MTAIERLTLLVEQRNKKQAESKSLGARSASAYRQGLHGEVRSCQEKRKVIKKEVELICQEISTLTKQVKRTSAEARNFAFIKAFYVEAINRLPEAIITDLSRFARIRIGAD